MFSETVSLDYRLFVKRKQTTAATVHVEHILRTQYTLFGKTILPLK